nr:NADH:ubiquinone oxidoreductase complex assembly factor 3 [Molossus molossus]
MLFMSEHERNDHSPVVNEVGQSEWKPAGEIPWRVHPSLIPSFWRKGRSHISSNSPSPFPRPQTKKEKSQPATLYDTWLSGNPEPPWAEESAEAGL